jgi:hypothetical protein
MLDDEPTPPAPVCDDWRPPSPPRDLDLLVRSIVGDLLSPVEGLRSLRAPRALTTLVTEAARGLLRTRGVIEPPPPSSLSGRVGAHRRRDPPARHTA